MLLKIKENKKLSLNRKIEKKLMLGTTIKRARADKTIFFLCDMQAIFEKKIYNMPAVIHSSKILCRASGILNIPLIATEHKPKVKF